MVKLDKTMCFTVDIGRDGFCAEILRVLPPGTEFDGVIDMEGNEVSFRGRILWAHAGAPYLGVRGRMGVRFLDSKDGRATHPHARDGRPPEAVGRQVAADPTKR